MFEKRITPIGYIHTDFTEKFGIPRQASLVPELRGVIAFEGRFTNPAAIRGMEEFSHLWLIWGFSESEGREDSLVVFPPRLGGKVKKGVFATRSPYRPNGLGLSCVKLEEISYDEKGAPILKVSGVDMLDGTPIYDIKPYIPYSDSMPDAQGGFGQALKDVRASVVFPEEFLMLLPEDKRQAAVSVLELDPRAAYNRDPSAVYGLAFAGCDIRFTVSDGVITVTDVVKGSAGGTQHIK